MIHLRILDLCPGYQNMNILALTNVVVLLTTSYWEHQVGIVYQITVGSLLTKRAGVILPYYRQH